MPIKTEQIVAPTEDASLPNPGGSPDAATAGPDHDATDDGEDYVSEYGEAVARALQAIEALITEIGVQAVLTAMATYLAETEPDSYCTQQYGAVVAAATDALVDLADRVGGSDDDDDDDDDDGDA